MNIKLRISVQFACIMVLLCSACATPSYLPYDSGVPYNTHGAHIKVIIRDSVYSEYLDKESGELISIDSQNLVMLSEDSKRCHSIPIKMVGRFKLRYARPRQFAFTIPLFSLATLSHGYIALFSLPINLIVTIAVTAAGQNEFTYSKKDITFTKLKLFARYPQGIPPNVRLQDIR